MKRWAIRIVIVILILWGFGHYANSCHMVGGELENFICNKDIWK